MRTRRALPVVATVATTVAATVLAAVVVAGLAPGAGSAATARAAGPTSSTTTLAPGATLTGYSFTLGSGRWARSQRVLVVTARLGAHLALVPAAGTGLVGGPRTDTLTIARRQQALAGINGDFFDLDDDFSPPRGGLMREGVLYKSARTDTAATVYVTGDGLVHIGNPGFHAAVTAADRATRKVGSVNNMKHAQLGGITLATAALAATRLSGRCTAAAVRTVVTTRTVRVRGTLRTVRTTWTLVGTVQRRVHDLARLPAGVRALVGCGDGGDWLAAHLRTGSKVTVTSGHTVPGVRSYIGGGRVLLRGGRAYRDTATSIAIPDYYRNPLTFACASADGRTARLGTVDGGSWSAQGMSYGELTTWLRDTLHCWSAIMFDGGGSTTMVARMPGATSLSVRNQPAYGFLRPVSDGLFLVRR